MASQHETTGNGKPTKKPQQLVWRKNLRPPVECHWSDIDPAIIRRTIDAATRAGGAVMFGVTSDGGAFSICVLHQNDKLKDYPHGKDECEQALLGVEQMFVEFLT